MHRVSIDPLRPSATALAQAAALIRDGGLVAFPTDTLYGLGADPRLPDAVDAVYRVKGRIGIERPCRSLRPISSRWRWSAG